MTKAIDPALWDTLSSEKVSDGIVVRRIAPDLEHDVHIGEKRPSREKILTLGIKGKLHSIPKASPGLSSRGLHVDVEHPTEELTKIRLTATSSHANPFFVELANDVVAALYRKPGVGAAGRVINRILAWQSFFAKQAAGFSLENASGLFAELVVLRDLLVQALGPTDAVYAWTGPDPGIQDFEYRGFALEVKSFRGNGLGSLRISSERQLDSSGLSSLYLAYVRLTQRTEGGGTTVDELISSVRTILRESEIAIDTFETKLLEWGWHNSYSESRREGFEIRSLDYFLVSDDFPRLIESDLPSGVGNVSYAVDRAAIEDFVVPPADLVNCLRGLT